MEAVGAPGEFNVDFFASVLIVNLQLSEIVVGVAKNYHAVQVVGVEFIRSDDGLRLCPLFQVRAFGVGHAAARVTRFEPSGRGRVPGAHVQHVHAALGVVDHRIGGVAVAVNRRFFFRVLPVDAVSAAGNAHTAAGH